MEYDYENDLCEGPLFYTFDPESGIYYLNNPIALMYAASKGLPAVGRDWSEIYLALEAAGERDSNFDELDGDGGRYLDAAKKVLAKLEHDAE